MLARPVIEIDRNFLIITVNAIRWEKSDTMLKFFLKMIWVILPLATYLSILMVGQQGFNIEQKKIKKSAKLGMMLGLLFSIMILIVKIFTVWLNKEYLTIFVNSGAIIGETIGLLCLVLSSSKLTQSFGKHLTVFSIGWLNLFAILLFVPDILFIFYQLYVSGETFLTTNTLFKFIGCLMAIFLIVTIIFCWMKLTKVLTKNERILILVFFFIVQIFLQVPTIIQPLLARRLIPFSTWLFNYIVFMNNHSKLIQISIFIGISLLIFYFLFKIKQIRVEGENSAIIRKKKIKKRYYYYYFVSFLAGALVLLASIQFGEKHLSQSTELAPAEEMIMSGVQILIPLNQVDDGHLHRFEYTTKENVKMRFIVVLKNETSYGVGLDACDICGATGYYERNDEIVCKLCDVVMNRSTIGFKGGCNPVPLNYSIENNQMVIQQADLDVEQSRFE